MPNITTKDELEIAVLVCRTIGARAGLSQRAVEDLVKIKHDLLKNDLGIPPQNLAAIPNDLTFISNIYHGKAVMPTEVNKAKTVRDCIKLTVNAVKQP